MTMTREQLIARRDELQAQIDASNGWGAAVGAMSEELEGIKRRLQAQVSENPCRQVDLPHVIQLGTGDRIITSGFYRGLPAVFIEPTADPRPPGTRGETPAGERHTLAPGATVIAAANLRSLEVLREHIDKAATKLMRGAAPLTEDECFMVEAAMYYGFQHVDDDATVFQANESQIVALVKAAREQGRQDVLSLQPRCVTWLDKVTEDDPTDLTERLARFFEESAEFVQSKGFTEAQAHDIVRYVFGRPAGHPLQEIGGAMTTMAVLCAFIGEDMFACAEAELARVDTPEMIQKIRDKRSRRHGRGVLPGTTEEADLVPAEKPYQAPFIGLPLSDGRMI